MELTLDTPATYRIRVQGYLDSGWSDCLSGLTISQSGEGDEPLVTTLSGTLYEFNQKLLSVETCFKTEEIDLHRLLSLPEGWTRANVGYRRVGQVTEIGSGGIYSVAREGLV